MVHKAQYEKSYAAGDRIINTRRREERARHLSQKTNKEVSQHEVSGKKRNRRESRRVSKRQRLINNLKSPITG